MNFPENLKYTKDHEWIQIDGETGIVGVTHYAQGELGDVVFVELPSVGKVVKAHDTFGTIEAVKAVSDLYAPISGSVVAVNPELEKTPEIVNKDPYGAGWLVAFALADPAELAGLMTASDYEAYVAQIAKQ